MNESEEIEYTDDSLRPSLLASSQALPVPLAVCVVPRPWNYRIDNGNELVLQDMFGDSLARFRIFGPAGRERLKWIADDSEDPE
jgi:hypothetical protein